MAKDLPRTGHTRSDIRNFFAGKLNRILLLTVISLVISLAFFLGFVTVPGLKSKDEELTGSNNTHSEISARYAVVKENFPDPTIVYDYGHHTGWYAFATRDKKVHVQMATSKNISTWVYHDGYDAMPTLGAWVASQVEDTQVWAPSVTNRVSESAIFCKHTTIKLTELIDDLTHSLMENGSSSTLR